MEEYGLINDCLQKMIQAIAGALLCFLLTFYLVEM
jgi:hypothetical protein